MNETQETAIQTEKPNLTVTALAYIIFPLPLYTKDRKNMFLRYHVQQGAGLFVFALALQGLHSILAYWYGVFGLYNLPGIQVQIVRILLLVFVVIGISNVFGGKSKPLPYIGVYAEKL